MKPFLPELRLSIPMKCRKLFIMIYPAAMKHIYDGFLKAPEYYSFFPVARAMAIN